MSGRNNVIYSKELRDRAKHNRAVLITVDLDGKESTGAFRGRTTIQCVCPDKYIRMLERLAIAISTRKDFIPSEVAREVLSRREKFMNINATAHKIHMWLKKHRKTPGVDWSGTTKASIAEAYATGERGLDDLTITQLIEEFGTIK